MEGRRDDRAPVRQGQRAWGGAVECRGLRSVEPSLAVLKDGTILLSGGGPGVKLRVNRDGTGEDWQEVDIGRYRYKFVKNSGTTGYTELARRVALSSARSGRNLAGMPPSSAGGCEGHAGGDGRGSKSPACGLES